MNNYEDWANLVAKKLKGEGDVIAAIDRDELDDSAATDVFVRTVLKPFLPENFGIGAGRIVDAFGNRSNYLDIVIYNRSFPRIGLRGTQSDYLYESVLAAFSIRAKYVRKTFFESMDACASMARLVTNVDKTVLIQLAQHNGLKPGPNKTFVHEDSVRTARFELIGSPPAFMFGFTGIKTSHRQLQENIELWIEQRTEDQVDLAMRAFPAVIATQGCFAWRNAAPLALSNREMLGIGNDHAPIRLIILQLLYLLNRRLNVAPDGYGLKPNLSAYLSQFSAPKFEQGVGDIDNLVSLKLANKSDTEADASPHLQPARDHSPKPGKAVPAAESSTKPVAKPAARPATKPVTKAAQSAARAGAASTAAPRKEKPPSKPTDDAAISSGVFDKPSPFASAPAPSAPAESVMPASKPRADAATPSGVFDKPSPFASAPAPEPSAPAKTAPYKPPTPTLGSAPIPGMASSQDAKPATKPVTAPPGSAPIPAKDSALDGDLPPAPPVDIELTDSFPMPDGKLAEFPDELPKELPATLADEPEAVIKPEFEATMIIAPDASLSNRSSGNSTDSFIERVKEQLSGSPSVQEEEPFIATVPQ
jgi:hypothetical protein